MRWLSCLCEVARACSYAGWTWVIVQLTGFQIIWQALYDAACNSMRRSDS
jgi:hypothetical protein